MRDIALVHDASLFDEIIKRCLPFADEGHIASYIPALAMANKTTLGIVLMDLAGQVFESGAVSAQFTMQSISKAISLLLALEESGAEHVFKVVGMEPTGDAFNSIIKLEYSNLSKPFNPFINAGAIAVCNLISGNSPEERFAKILNFTRKISSNPLLDFDHTVYLSEKATGHRNRSMGYFLKDIGLLQGDVEDTLDVYFKQCAIKVNCKDLAAIGAVLANNGLIPGTGERVIQANHCRIVNMLMITCGLYNGSGEFAIKVGLPAKSGVSGGILVSVPRKCGIGVFGPALDDKGNSLAGIKMLEALSDTLKLHLI